MDDGEIIVPFNAQLAVLRELSEGITGKNDPKNVSVLDNRLAQEMIYEAKHVLAHCVCEAKTKGIEIDQDKIDKIVRDYAEKIYEIFSENNEKKKTKKFKTPQVASR